MKNLKFYILAIVAFGLIANSCKDIVQNDDGDNKTDTTSVEKGDAERKDAIKMGDIKDAKTKVVEISLSSLSAEQIRVLEGCTFFRVS